MAAVTRGPGRFRLANPPGRNRTGPTTAAGHFQIRSTPFKPTSRLWTRRHTGPPARVARLTARFSGRRVVASRRLFQHTSHPTGMPGSPAMSVGGRRLHRLDRALRGDPLRGGARRALSGPGSKAPPIRPSAKNQLAPKDATHLLSLQCPLKQFTGRSKTGVRLSAKMATKVVEILPGQAEVMRADNRVWPAVLLGGREDVSVLRVLNLLRFQE